MVDLTALRTATRLPQQAPAPAAPAGEPTAEPLHGPDLVVDGLRASNPFPFPGDAVWFSVTVRNQGDAPAGPFSVGLRGQAMGPDQRVPGLAPGQSYRLPGMGPVWTSFGGQAVSVQAVVDTRDEVRETNESNNWAWETVWVQQPPMPPPLPPHPAAPTVLLAE